MVVVIKVLVDILVDDDLELVVEVVGVVAAILVVSATVVVLSVRGSLIQPGRNTATSRRTIYC